MTTRDNDILAAEAIAVTIFNQTYTLRSHTGAEQIKQVAHLVDERMQQIAAYTTTHDVAKIAILAALNIADELRRLQLTRAEAWQEGMGDTKAAGTAPAQPEAGAGSQAPERRSWFEDIFDAPVAEKNNGERMSSQIARVLQARRQDEQELRPRSIAEDEAARLD
jgi:cell division protein ZapA